MRFLVLLITTMLLAPFTYAQKPICGKVVGKTHNRDSIKRPYELSGFWIKQNTFDIRVTFGTSPELIEEIQELQGSLFICLDEYILEEKTYAKKVRLYATSTNYRIWMNGEEL